MLVEGEGSRFSGEEEHIERFFVARQISNETGKEIRTNVVPANFGDRIRNMESVAS